MTEIEPGLAPPQADGLAELRAQLSEARETIRQRTAELEQADRNLDSFTFAVSHDLRAPLRALSGFTEILAEEYGDKLDEVARGYTERIKSAGERMTALIDGLLQLSRVSRAVLAVRPVDLSAEANAIADELRSADPDRQAGFRIQPGVLVTADRSLIRSALQNLLENAWKYTSVRDEAVIEFGAVAGEGTAVRSFLRDNGIGFDSSYAEKIFQPFQRLHGAGEYPGAGMGLTTAQRAIEKHGGRIWAESTAGEGATFFFTLPPVQPPS